MKNDIILGGVYDLFLNLKKELWFNRLDYNNKDSYMPYIGDLKVVNECFRIYNANRQRKKNNWNELVKWCYAIENINTHKKYKLIFGTLTFKDKVLSNTAERTRTRYVTKFLNENTFHYIANIDYGAKNNREHYHFIAMVEDKIDSSKWSHGASKFQFIKMNKNDIKAVKNYLLKLNNHSYKNSTHQKRIIRDRKIDVIIDQIIDEKWNDSFHKYKLKINEYDRERIQEI